MKLLSLTFAICILILQTVKSQDTVIRSSTYVARISQIYNHPVKGYLVTINDSSLYLSRIKVPLSLDNVNTAHLEKFDYRSILEVKLSRPKSMGKSIIIGAVIGIVVGAIIGHAQGDDSGWFGLSSGDKAVIGGIIGAGAGTITGAIIAKSSEKKFLINGDWKSLKDMKESLQYNK